MLEKSDFDSEKGYGIEKGLSYENLDSEEETILLNQDELKKAEEYFGSENKDVIEGK